MMLTLFFNCARSTRTVFTIRSIPMQQGYQHHEATVTLHHHMEHMNDDKEDEEDDEDCTENDDLLDELVVAAIRTCCIEYNTEEEEKEDNEEIYNQPTMVSSRKRRRAPARQVMWTDENGRHHQFTPKSSLWYCIYVAYPDLDDDVFHKKFRARFCMPYNQFTHLVVSLQIEHSFCRWHEGSVSCIKKEATPISLLVFCSLRYLGRGWTFDDLSENTAISIEVIRTF